jgi:hypothetical protein
LHIINEAPHSQPIELKKNSLKVSLNGPKEPGTNFEGHIYLLGEDYKHIKEELVQWLGPS